jgi:hypothetical protein
MLGKVRSDVAKDTKNAQIPWTNEALEGELYLNPQVARAARNENESRSDLVGSKNMPPARTPETSSRLTVEQLIGEYTQLDGFCRGGYGIHSLSITLNCEKRAEVHAILQERGYCLGREGQSNSEFRWHKCNKNSYRLEAKH